MIAITDYSVGNLFSIKSSLDVVGAESIITKDAQVLRSADKIILPGVGAFRNAHKKLAESGLGEVIIEEAKKGKPILGICLGMQLLFDKSYEYGEYSGLGLIKGTIKPIADAVGDSLSIPHIGWNALIMKKETPIFKYLENGDCVYFVHSYYAADCEESVTSTTEYGCELTASVQRDNIYGCQFHPEKSGKAGLSILKAFAEL